MRPTARIVVVATLGAMALGAGCKRELADAPAPRAGEHFKASVLRVSDGDSFAVERDGKRLRVRLFGIDAPERSQRFGNEATKFLRERIDDKTVELEVRAVDRYGRAVAVVRVDGDKQPVNHALVAAGLAWWYRRYAPADKALAALQREARAKKRGVWSEARPVSPWQFRRARRHRMRFPRRRRRRSSE
ncbi:MAG: thermonuclease family protein [Myxococcales bacterium]|nr:thermonuclease family protein [Myxococcales bacterium]